MVKINLTILLIAIVGLAVTVSGCINSRVSTQRTQEAVPTVSSPSPIQTPVLVTTPTVNQYSSMSFTAFKEAMKSNDLTTLQKKNLYVNKIFRWDGQVMDVTSDTVTILIREYVNYKTDDLTNYDQKHGCYSYNTDKSCETTNIRLHASDDQKSQLNSLSKDRIVTFEGTITSTDVYVDRIDMDNGKIISSGSNVFIIGR